MNDDPATTCTPHPPPTADGSARSFDPVWRTETVRALATGIETERAFDRLPILADALENVGCDDEMLLRHCRECHQHEAECWVVGLLLERAKSKSPPSSFEWGDDGVPSIYSREYADRLEKQYAESGLRSLDRSLFAMRWLRFLIWFVLMVLCVWVWIKLR